MKNLKVSVKLIVSFLTINVLAIIVGVIGMAGMNSINNADDALYNENVVALSAMGNIREMLQDQRVHLRDMALNAGNTVVVQEHLDILVSLEEEMEAMFAEYEKTIVNASAETSYFQAKETYLNEYAQTKSGIVEASFVGFEEAQAAIFDPVSAEITATMVDEFNKSMDNNDQWARETVESNTGLFRTMLIIEIIVLTFAVAVAVSLALYISGLIGKPLAVLAAFMKKAGSTGDLALTPEDFEVIGKFSQVKDEIGQTVAGAATFVKQITTVSGELEKIACGDLTVEVKLLSEKDTMGLSLKQMVENLNNMFAEIATSTNQVSTGSKQVAEGAQSLAQGSTEQAASIEELSGSIAEINERTKANAATADKTSKLSEEIKGNAERGSRQMDEMISAVKDINEASSSISNIIKTIDDIAFQTNILALNAAVEAARAGQHGKGFAVVAEEVRNLASKSAEAAKDTGNMIQNSMEKAAFGSQIAEETATSLKDIVSGINESNHLVAEIARASEEQSQAITQINTGIDQVAMVIQQNSATAQESAAASEEMSGQSDMLNQLISQFKLKEANTLLQGLPPSTL